MWTAIHRQLPDAWPQAFRPPRHERLVGVEPGVWAANSPYPPLVVLPRRTGHASWETVVVLWGWVAVCGTGCHVFTPPRGTVIETDWGMAWQLMAEPLTTHVVVAVLQWGADRPQPWRDPVTRPSGVTCRSLGPPSGQEEQGGICQVHSSGCGTAETLLPHQLSCVAPWNACTPSPGTTSWWPRTMGRSSATTWSRWQPTWCSAWPLTL